MIEAGRKGQDLARRPLDDLFGPPPFLRRLLHQPVGQRSPEISVPRLPLRQVLKPFHQQLGGLAGQVQHAFRRHAEPTGRSRVRRSAVVLGGSRLSTFGTFSWTGTQLYADPGPTPSRTIPGRTHGALLPYRPIQAAKD